MSTEINTLLAEAAPAPARPLDVGSIMRRGNGLRLRRMLATVVVVPALIATVWVAAQIGVGRPETSRPATAPTSCAQESRLMAFLRDDVTPSEVEALVDELGRSPHVLGVTFVSKDDAYSEFKQIYRDQPEFWESLPRDALPARLDVSVDSRQNEDVIAARVAGAPGVDEVQLSDRRRAACQHREYERRIAELRKALRRTRADLSEARQRARSDGEAASAVRQTLKARLDALRGFLDEIRDASNETSG